MNILYAPIGITPTKPLTASHLRGVLLIDAMRKLRAKVDTVTVWHNRRPWDLSLQTTRFWGYLDRAFPDHDFSQESAINLGLKYIKAHQDAEQIEPSTTAFYAGKVDGAGYLHPSAQRLIELWGQSFSALSVDAGILTCSEPLQLSTEQVVTRLAELDILLDQRPQGGGCYIDLSEQGLPLRKIIDPDSGENYLVAILRDIWARSRAFDKTFLVYDNSVERDYVLIEKVLSLSGVACQRCVFKRVPINGVIASSREGGWKGSTAGEITSLLSGFSPAAKSLGARVYFLHHIGIRNPSGYNPDELVQQTQRCEQLLSAVSQHTPEPQPLSFWHQFITRTDDVDVYRALSLLFSRKAPVAHKAALVECLL